MYVLEEGKVIKSWCQYEDVTFRVKLEKWCRFLILSMFLAFAHLMYG